MVSKLIHDSGTQSMDFHELFESEIIETRIEECIGIVFEYDFSCNILFSEIKLIKMLIFVFQCKHHTSRSSGCMG